MKTTEDAFIGGVINWICERHPEALESGLEFMRQRKKLQDQAEAIRRGEEPIIDYVQAGSTGG